MKEPNNKIELGIFVTQDRGMFSSVAKIGLKHTVSHSWPMTRLSQHKDIVTVNLPPKQLKSGDNKVRYFEYKDIKAAINETVPTFVDYNTPIEDVLELLNRSKVHICYQGGTAWISVAMNIPTIIVHTTVPSNQIHLKPKLFGQDLGNINIIENNKINHVRSHPVEHHIHINDLAQTLKEILK